jgi:glycerol-3-phosphate dehydrogenase
MPPMIEAFRHVDSISQLNGDLFDAVIVGGGINGAAVARDATLRGLRVCLFEQGDFASGTSSKSTKIAHGGLRYLRTFEFDLVLEAQTERMRLRKLLPHLVEQQSFCYPVYRGAPDPLWKVRLGLTIYDGLTWLGSHQREKPPDARAALQLNPMLRTDGLVGALRYWDDRMDDARVCLETVLSAEQAGASCFNYTGVEAVRRAPGGLFEVDVRDGDASGSVRARAIVNCAGPWADSVLTKLLHWPSRHLALTKGVHIVVPRIAGEDALTMENRHDRRTFFAIPWDDVTLIGTTDTRYEGDPSDVAVEQTDIDYLIDAAGFYLPAAGLKASDVIYSFAGLRALVAPGGRDVPEGQISRRHRVLVEPEGVVTLIGGKYTTFRQMAQDATDALLETLGERRRPCITQTAAYFPSTTPTTDARADPALWAWLRSRYGPRAGAVFDLCATDDALREPVVPGYDLRLGELVFSLRDEKARSMSDLVHRRTRLAWRRELTPEVVTRIQTLLESFVPAGVGAGT